MARARLSAMKRQREQAKRDRQQRKTERREDRKRQETEDVTEVTAPQQQDDSVSPE